jgi:hypothetical protein
MSGVGFRCARFGDRHLSCGHTATEKRYCFHFKKADGSHVTVSGTKATMRITIDHTAMYGISAPKVLA